MDFSKLFSVEEVREKLYITPGNKVICLVCLRSVDGDPMMVEPY